MFKSMRKKSLANEAFGLEVALQRNDYDQVVFFLNTVEDPIPEHSMVSLFQYCIRNAYNDLFFAQIPKFQEKIETLDLVSEFVRMAIDHQNTDVFKFFVENTNIEDTNGCLLCAAVEAANTDMVQQLLPFTNVQAQQSLALRKALHWGLNNVVDILLPLSDLTDFGYGVFNIVCQSGDEHNCKKLLDHCNVFELLSFLEFDEKMETYAFVEKVSAQKQKDLINQELSEINDSACERKRKM